MSDFKDHFSKQSESYAKYRPQYPSEIFTYLASLSPAHDLALDVATGNGQAALGLVPFYQKITATDASQAQLQKAIPHAKIDYLLSPAEKCPLDSHSVDLITIATALHWFDLDKFYTEAKRLLKPKSVIAAWCYNNTSEKNEADILIREFVDKVGSYFPQEVKKWVWEDYKTIPFPFEEIASPSFSLSVRWNLDAFLGYLSSWSATQRYVEATGKDPFSELRPQLEKVLLHTSGFLKRTWPIHIRIGRA